MLHAGFYYTADSLKARFTRDGNRELQAYCRDRGLRLDPCGKLVVCRHKNDLAGLKTLYQRGQKNGVELDWISAAQARKIDPAVATKQAALWSPHTASVDPVEVVQALAQDARQNDIDIKTGCAYLGRQGKRGIKTSLGDINAGYVINTAGLYADKIAHDFGFSKRYRVLPFKGLYLYATNPAPTCRVHVYPVPDLNHPFLGVHLTRTVDGKAKIGPTAIPAFWRENYNGFERFNLKEALEIIGREGLLWVRNAFDFRTLAWQELKKYHKAFMITTISTMIPDARAMAFRQWGTPGIRSQLLRARREKVDTGFSQKAVLKQKTRACPLNLSKRDML